MQAGVDSVLDNSKVDVTSTVFVVDDDVSVRESLQLLISTAGWQPKTFASAEEFLAQFHGAIPCCIVLDIDASGSKWSRTAEPSRRAEERADHLHHWSPGRAHDRSGDEGWRV